MNIEKGCLALIVKSTTGNTGTCVEVGAFIGAVPFFGGENRWEVDPPILAKYGEPVNHADESQLIRRY